eukprot:TRINITY_DN1213_c3_g1_i1.p1 TRINITY_DN1213_c3_g1~~TRINITY_DN1213_c3_g1_i1.p1  ORF type:complete len:463 (+),score=77.61 TRINITY_DN1213_c3_g1_i1:73-1389(+)
MEEIQVDNAEEAFRVAIERGSDSGCLGRQCLAVDRLDHGLQVSEDCLAVTHSVSGNSISEASIQSLLPLGMNCGIGYYEITIHYSHAHCGIVVIGLAHQGYPNNKQPGARKYSCGYRSDDGRKAHNNGDSIPYSDSYTAGDIVGCGYCKRTKQVWFTKNGKHLGPACTFPTQVVIDHLYPTIGIEHSSISVNFDHSTTAWSPSEAISEERQFILKDVRNVELGAHDPTPELVASYLLHSGYKKTFESFKSMNPLQSDSLLRNATSKREPKGGQESGSEGDDVKVNEVLSSKLKERNEVVQSIIDGNIEAAMEAAEKHFPSVKETIWPILISQLIIEETRKGNLKKAIAVASDPLGNTSSGPHTLVSKAMGLLAYKDPKTSPLSSLLEQSQRRRTAGSVNAVILSDLKFYPESVIESLLKHIIAIPLVAKKCYFPIAPE